MDSLGWEDSLEKRMATRSSILAWQIRTEGPDRLPPMVLQRIQCHWATNLSCAYSQPDTLLLYMIASHLDPLSADIRNMLWASHENGIWIANVFLVGDSGSPGFTKVSHFCYDLKPDMTGCWEVSVFWLNVSCPFPFYLQKYCSLFPHLQCHPTHTEVNTNSHIHVEFFSLWAKYCA